MAIEKRVVHRFIRDISEYLEGGEWYNQVIPLDTQAYAIYPTYTETGEEVVGKKGLYYVIGDGNHTYLELRDGTNSTEISKEYMTISDEVFNTKIDTLLPGKNIIIEGEGNSRTISAADLTGNETFISIEDLTIEVTIGQVLENLQLSLVTPVLSSSIFEVGDLVIFTDGTQAIVISIESSANRYKGVIVAVAPKDGSTFTNNSPSVIEVGGIKKGSTFDNRDLQEMFDMMLYPELYPTLTNPSGTFTANVNNVIEINKNIDITFKATLNRGSISPSYGTSGFRSGNATKYTYNGPNLPSVVNTTANSDTQVISYTPSTTGLIKWTSIISYAQGEQPLSSKGNDYQDFLPPGNTTSKSFSVTVVYPFYATTVSVTEMTKQPLTAASYFEANLIGEDDFGNKQSIEYSASLNNLSGIEFFNTVSKAWEWLNGSRASSISSFRESQVSYEGIQYKKYTNTSDKVGARQLRFYVN